jgi:hypothetical protein
MVVTVGPKSELIIDEWGSYFARNAQFGDDQLLIGAEELFKPSQHGRRANVQTSLMRDARGSGIDLLLVS